MFTSVVLLVALAGLPPPPALDDEPPPGAARSMPGTSDEDAGPGVIERFFPTDLDEDLHPAVEEDLWMFFAAGVAPIPFGGVFLPMLMIRDMPKDYVGEGIISYLVHLLPVLFTFPLAFFGGAIGIYAGLIGLVGTAYAALFGLLIGQQNPSAAGACLAIPLGLLCFAGTVAICEVAYVTAVLVNVYWLLPVSLANAASRALYNEEAYGGRRSSALDLPPSSSLATASRGMAY